MITAAAAVPLLIIAGSALDVGRMMLVKNRLQHACDASALAYRHSMNGSNVVSTTEPSARAFFNANFNANRYGAGAPSVSFSVDSQVVVHASASVTMPMLVMGLFGAKSTTLAATCDAQEQLPNTDVMFVLDTTGSMTDTNPGDTVNKITALRTAVINFYTSLEAVKVTGTQIRYGFVPYSNTVNVGMLLKRDWMVNSATYQSPVFDHQSSQYAYTIGGTVDYTTNWVNGPGFSQSHYVGNPEACYAPVSDDVISNYQYSAWTPSSTAIPRQRTGSRLVNGNTYAPSMQSNGTCWIYVNTYNNVTQTWTEIVDNDPNAGQVVYYTYNWYWYKPVAYDVSSLKGSNSNGLMAGGSFNAPIMDPPTNMANPPTAAANATISWGGSNACIEERKTLRPGESGTAYDMDPDLVPDPGNPDTQWRPFLPQLEFGRGVPYFSSTSSDASGWGWHYDPVLYQYGYVAYMYIGGSVSACPTAAQKLTSKENGLTLTAITNYVNSLTPSGDTYHDVGFLWGLRLISAQGLFASENTSAPNGGDISRNIIFMTDGATETHIQEVDAYGLSALDRRRTTTNALPTDAQQNATVENRLQTYCAAARGKGMTIWVIAFGTTLTSNLQNCASAGRAYQADNAAALNSAFADIASRIAQLRLTH